MSLAWELPNKGKEKVSEEILKPEGNFGSTWLQAYQDIYATIRERDNAEQFKQKL